MAVDPLEPPETRVRPSLVPQVAIDQRQQPLRAQVESVDIDGGMPFAPGGNRLLPLPKRSTQEQFLLLGGSTVPYCIALTALVIGWIYRLPFSSSPRPDNGRAKLWAASRAQVTINNTLLTRLPPRG